ncbi:UNVERIFIED_CONTAM: hypothetical protein Sradi_5112400 [Sesamum radiatum]|uniref:Uncharacterized protein n=1 Tax=Sesamum radiatum TaxID=300843 RepID=A0AAW2M4M0_SESRA
MFTLCNRRMWPNMVRASLDHAYCTSRWDCLYWKLSFNMGRWWVWIIRPFGLILNRARSCSSKGFISKRFGLKVGNVRCDSPTLGSWCIG